MGSGCNQNKGKSKCFQTISDCCVQYTGPEIPLLGICTGDMLCEVEAVIIDKLLEAMEGFDISVIDLSCEFISDQLAGSDPDLATLLQILVDSNCTLKEMIDTINGKLEQAVTFDLKCISATSNDIPGVVQGLINAVCVMRDQIDNLQDQINDQSDISGTVKALAGNLLHSNLNSCAGYGLAKTGSAESAHIDFYGFVPPMCPIPCFAPLSNFNSLGVGLPNTAFCGFYICNGNNGTPDMRGFVFAGATSLPGISANNPLHSSVDPVIHGAPFASSLFDAKGTLQVPLSFSQMPSHSHTATLPAHSHTVTIHKPSGIDGGTLPAIAGTNQAYTSPPPQQIATSTSPAIQFQTSPAGESQPHNNVQPTRYGYWIMRLS